ncbi:MAG TPA: triose-phosphate isomerase [Flavitalea sp.]|nr:triose-phosphate isomerase [Flavitalea sp.]
MRKQIAAANWKMNCTYHQAESLLNDVLQSKISLKPHQAAVFAIPFPYLIMANSLIGSQTNCYVSAQNCHHKLSGAYTGEVSAEMIRSLSVRHCIVGHSERREYFNETNEQLAEKLDLCLKFEITPIFCCGEPLPVREEGTQNAYVEKQLRESLFHLSAEALGRVVIAYEPIWAIGTGKTATTEQAQEIHAFIRSVIGDKFGEEAGQNISILYGGSVKAGNAAELFGSPDVDGGLVGGASLVAADFVQIINALKS